MPPKSSIQAEWTTPKLGGLDADFVAQAEIPGAKEVAAASGPTSEGAVAVAPSATAAKPAATKPAPVSKDELASAPALRVPFGRGPKDKAFERERKERSEERQRHSGVRHKRRKR
jgi:hypothetical protein